ncbi:hypothetical protein BDW68DRAFT_176159 [Aspergillus falconensis]
MSRRELGPVRSPDLIQDSTEVFAWPQEFVRACQDTVGGYRSLFGQTYATLFPWRPKRVIIDGVVDSFNWYNGVFQSESQLDTDAVLNGFFDECTKAGPENRTLAYIWVFADSM